MKYYNTQQEIFANAHETCKSL